MISSFNLSLFRRDHRNHERTTNSSNKCGFSRTISTRFSKVPLEAWCLLIQLKSTSQTWRRPSQSHSAWRQDSAFEEHWWQVSSSKILLFFRFSIFGSALVQAFHKNCFTFPGTLAFHNFFPETSGPLRIWNKRCTRIFLTTQPLIARAYHIGSITTLQPEQTVGLAGGAQRDSFYFLSFKRQENAINKAVVPIIFLWVNKGWYSGISEGRGGGDRIRPWDSPGSQLDS